MDKSVSVQPMIELKFFKVIFQWNHVTAHSRAEISQVFHMKWNYHHDGQQFVSTYPLYLGVECPWMEGCRPSGIWKDKWWCWVINCSQWHHAIVPGYGWRMAGKHKLSWVDSRVALILTKYVCFNTKVNKWWQIDQLYTLCDSEHIGLYICVLISVWGPHGAGKR